MLLVVLWAVLPSILGGKPPYCSALLPRSSTIAALNYTRYEVITDDEILRRTLWEPRAGTDETRALITLQSNPGMVRTNLPN